MSLTPYLVLQGFIARSLGFEQADELLTFLKRFQTGRIADGRTWYAEALEGCGGPGDYPQRGISRVQAGELRAYDTDIRQLEDDLRRHRGAEFAFKHFQYAALLFTEIYLDRLTQDPQAFLRALNDFNTHWHNPALEHLALPNHARFELEDLRRLAWFMATGSGKTLLMHAHIHQVTRYLQQGAHPEALVHNPAAPRRFANVLLITPGPTLSQQHLDEFARSGITAVELSANAPTASLYTQGPVVQVVNIQRLTPRRGDEATLAQQLLEGLGSANLVLVDEGHKGASGVQETDTAIVRGWRSIRNALSADGMMLQYSATFAQMVGSGNGAQALRAEYGKSILFDYSYRHFYADNYGKDFRILVSPDDGVAEADAHPVLVAALLAYYHQLCLWEGDREGPNVFRSYQIEKPLWIFLGTTVAGSKSNEQRETATDVARIVRFLARFLRDADWARGQITSILDGEASFSTRQAFIDLAAFLQHSGGTAEAIYTDVCDRVFHGQGALEAVPIARANNAEIGLKTSGGSTYFGVVNVGDAGALRTALTVAPNDLAVQSHPADNLAGSLFDEIEEADSPINVLVGARKFIEGWSSWRVSTMGLLNVGQSQGPQVIQLFGRGVRLKGQNWSLQRSANGATNNVPDGLRTLETLQIFGYRANYLNRFQEVLERDGLPTNTVTIPLDLQIDVAAINPPLQIPQPAYGQEAAFKQNVYILTPQQVADGPEVRLNLRSAWVTMHSQNIAGQAMVIAEGAEVAGMEPNWEMVDMDALYVALLEHKVRQEASNVYVPRERLRQILSRCPTTLASGAANDPHRIQEAARLAVTTWFDKYVKRETREAESADMVPRGFQDFITPEDLIRCVARIGNPPVHTGLDLNAQITTLLSSGSWPGTGDVGTPPLPRLHFDRHLVDPILLKGNGEWARHITLNPPGLEPSEETLIRDLRSFWQAHHQDTEYQDLEIFLWRNPSRTGVGFFQRSGFYPDFLLWLRRNGWTHLRFVEPHGMVLSQGVMGNRDKFDALLQLPMISQNTPAFQSACLSMDGCILSPTPINGIAADPDGTTAADMEAQGVLYHQDPQHDYVERILRWPGPPLCP